MLCPFSFRTFSRFGGIESNGGDTTFWRPSLNVNGLKGFICTINNFLPRKTCAKAPHQKRRQIHSLFRMISFDKLLPINLEHIMSVYSYFTLLKKRQNLPLFSCPEYIGNLSRQTALTFCQSVWCVFYKTYYHNRGVTVSGDTSQTVLVCDPVDPLLLEGLRAKGLDVRYRPDISRQELLAVVGEYAILVVRSRTKVSREVIEAGSKLRLVARAGIGTDNIDLAAASARGIEIVTAAGSSTQSVAELNVGLAIIMARNLLNLSNGVRDGEWKKLIGSELFNKTAGIIGYGRIGHYTARILHSMGLRILAYDVVKDTRRIAEVDGTYVSLDMLLKDSDIIFLLASFSQDSNAMLGSHHLNQMKESAFIVNTSRAEFINGPELLNALETHRISGYAADVTWNEPPSEDWEKRIISMKNVIITPHIGAQTIEAQRRVAEFTLRNLLEKMEAMGL